MKKFAVFTLLLVLLSLPVLTMAQDNFVFGDPLPDAPALALRGDYGVGVQTLNLVHTGQIDVLNVSAENPAPTYDRPLTVEVWYPATIPDGAVEMTTYEDTLGRADAPETLKPFSFAGRALRDAEPDASGAPYPLVVVSHGYPGSRFMLTYLTENLASKGYVVVAIDHTDSTFADVSSFGSTLVNRPLDQIFVIDEMARLSTEEGFLNGLLDANNTGLIGYSMGGYGALNVLGAGYNGTLQGFMGDVVGPRLAGAEGYQADERVKAGVVFAPWGGDLSAVGAPGAAFWDLDALGGISAPTFWVAGSLDDVAIYDGIVRLFESADHSERYLLTYENALHNVAPNPPPAAATEHGDYERYAEPAWDEAHINNVNQHFITAFLGYYLKNDESMAAYLNLAVVDSNEGVVALDEAGNPTAEHTYWTGFLPRTAVGLSLQHLPLQ